MNNEPKGLELWQEQGTEAAASVVPQRVALARRRAVAARRKHNGSKRVAEQRLPALLASRLTVADLLTGAA